MLGFVGRQYKANRREISIKVKSHCRPHGTNESPSNKMFPLHTPHRTSCGALVEVRPTDRHFFKLRDPDSKHKNGYFHHTLFHPGQTLVGPIQSLENEKWLTPKPDRQHRRTKVRSQLNYRFLRFRLNGVKCPSYWWYLITSVYDPISFGSN